MELILKRIAKKAGYTVGRLSIRKQVVDEYLPAEEDTYLCDTAFGQGWIPKDYIEFLENEDEYWNYRTYHPSIFNHDPGPDKKPDPWGDEWDDPGPGNNYYPDYPSNGGRGEPKG